MREGYRTAREWLPREQLVDDPARPVDVASDRQSEADVGAERAARVLAVGPVSGHRLFVAVEDQADDVERPVEDRTARVAAGNVVGRDEIHRQRGVLLTERG